VLFPQVYAWIWTRRTCFLAVALCWALTGLCNAIIIADWVMYKQLRMLLLMYNFVSFGVLSASMAIYALASFRKVLERMLRCSRRGRAESRWGSEESRQLISSGPNKVRLAHWEAQLCLR
jgi:hypothetical protein